jgi:L-amino acid N-acyltransferase YncA
VSVVAVESYGSDPAITADRAAPRIRRARRQEIDEIVALIGRAHAETYAPPTLDIQQYLADAATKADRHRRFWRTYLVAEKGDRIVGVVQTFHNVVNALYVDKDARGSGIGALLLGAAEVAMRAKGVASAQVRIADGYPRVRAFYERHGWQVAGKAEELPSDARWGLQLLEMRKRLGTLDDRWDAIMPAILKAVITAGALVLIVPSFVWMHSIAGLTKEASAVVGAAVAAVVILFVFRMRSPNFGLSRTLMLSAAAAGIYLAVLMGAVVLGWLGLQAAGVQAQAAHDQAVTSMLVLCALVLLMRRAARSAVVRFWTRYAL